MTKIIFKIKSLKMKQVTALFTFVLVAFTTYAQTMTFGVTTIDYGLIDKGAEPLRKFKFTNTGIMPLIIKNARSSCGCVRTRYPEKPILPGESNVIEVRYDTQRTGHFIKTITLETNDLANETMVLTIKGEVKKSTDLPSVPSGYKGKN